MRVLFIGGTGNISAECAALLHDTGHEIGVLTRGRTPVPSRYRALAADRKNRAELQRATGQFAPEAVINFLGFDVSDVQLDFEVWSGKVAQYIFISSATVYQKPPPRLPIAEDTPLENRWWEYARKKIACEQWLMQKWRADRFPVTIVRPSHTYSKRWVPNPVSSSSFTFCDRLMKGKPVFLPDDGESLWTLTAASDFAVGVKGLLGNKAALGEAFHITSDEVLSWNQIVAEIADALGASAPNVVRIPTDFICEVAPQMVGSLKGDKAHPGVFDNSKIKRFVPGFECRKPFREGVKESIDWLRAHPEDQNLNPAVDDLCDRVVNAWSPPGPRPSPAAET